MLNSLVSTFGLQLVVSVGLALIGFYVIRVAYAMREGARWLMRAICIATLVYFAGVAILPGFKLQQKDVQPLSLLAGLFALGITPSRGRYITRKVKREVIERDLKGDKYDSRKHHIDHIWPHSRGGSNTGDNLRVIGKKQNLRKGAKRPSLTDWL
jgi:hypothetical protein